MPRPCKQSIRTSFAVWLARVTEIVALLREDRVTDAYDLAPSIFRFCFPVLARLYNDPAATPPTEADFHDYQLKCRHRKASRPANQPRPPREAPRQREQNIPTAFSSFEECLKLKEKPPGMSDARWRMIQAVRKRPDHYEARGI